MHAAAFVGSFRRGFVRHVESRIVRDLKDESNTLRILGSSPSNANQNLDAEEIGRTYRRFPSFIVELLIQAVQSDASMLKVRQYLLLRQR